MKTRLNVRLLVYLLLSTVVLGGGLYSLHAFQVQRNATALLRLAKEAEGKGELRKTAKYLRLYLMQVPSDRDVLATYALTLSSLAGTPDARVRAFFALGQAVGRNPARSDVRKRLVELAMHRDLERFTDAEEHLRTLLRSSPTDGELEHRLAQCRAVAGKFTEAAQHYRAAIKYKKDLLDGYARLAGLLRHRLSKPDEADRVMSDLVAANASSLDAWLARARYLRDAGARDADSKARQKRFDEAAADLRRARQLAGTRTDALAEVLLETAGLAEGKGDLAEARKILGEALAAHPKGARPYLALARLEARDKRLGEAIAVLRKGVQQLPEENELHWSLAQMVIQNGEPEKAAEIAARLRTRGFPEPLLDCLDARTRFHKGQWLEASRLLDRVYPQLRHWPEIRLQADLLLGACHLQLGDEIQQHAAFQRAVTAEPLSEPARLGLASALMAMNQLQRAFEACRPVAYRSPAARLLATRILILRTLAEPPARRRWEPIKGFLKEVEQAAPDSPELAILRAELLAAQDQMERARAELDAAGEKRPENVELWAARAAVARKQNRWQDALALLDRAERRIGAQVELRLARARLWSERGGDEAKQALLKIGEDLGRFKGDDWRRLVLALAEAHLRLAQTAEAEQLYARLAEREPGNLGVRILLFDLALRAGKDAAAARLVEDLRRIEGDDGTLWRFGQACRLIRQAKAGDKAALAQAVPLVTRVAARRPGWARVALAQAEIHELGGKPELALRSYRQAIDAGERNPEVIRRAVELLHQRGQLAEVEQMLQKLQAHGTLLTDLGRVEAELALHRQDTARALLLARKAVSADSKDHRDLIWLGQVLCAANRWPEAEPLFRRAVAVAEQAPEAWVSLVHYLARMDQKDKAEALVARAREKLPKDEAALAAAQCYEILGRNERAQGLYEAALAARPKDLLVLRHLARFALRMGKLPQAERHLRTIVALQGKAGGDTSWARRLLAVVLVAGGDYQQSRQALAVLGILDRDQLRDLTAGETAEDLRAKALVLASQRTLAHKRRAIEILEGLSGKQPQAEDQFMLAQLYEAVGDARRAREQMLTLLARQPDEPRYLAHFTASLLKSERLPEAEARLARLEKLEPKTFRTLRLKALALQARGKAAEALPFLSEFAGGDPGRLGAVAQLLDQLGQGAAAEELYRKLAAESKRPESVLVLALFLGRQGRAEEALRLCEGAWKTCPADKVVQVSLEVLFTAKGGVAHAETVARQLEAARAAAPDKTGLAMGLAAVRRLQGRYADAVTLYREVVRRDKADALALNNLAWLLALGEGKGAEALEVIQQAVEAAGPLPTLLDTRAVIQLTLGRSAAAVKDLEEAVTLAPSPSRHFHLARAYALAGNRTLAARALQQARAGGLDEGRVDSLERDHYRRLCGELESK